MIDLTTLFSSLGIVSGNTSAKNQYEFYYGITWDDVSVTYTQKEFFDKVGLSRYDFFKQYTDEKTFYEDVDDTRINDYKTFYEYAGEYLSGGDPQVPATAAFTSSTQSTTPDTTITFTNTSTGTAPISYTWDFGDGNIDVTTSPTHSYSATGSYVVSLTASNAYGISSATTSIDVISASSPQTYTNTGTGAFADFNYPKGTGTTYNERYFRYGFHIQASELSGISNTNVSSFRVTSNKNEDISYNSYKVYMKNGTYTSATLLDIGGLSPVLTKTSGIFNTWTALSNYYYEDYTLDSNFIWDGSSDIAIIVDMDSPNPSYASAATSNFVVTVGTGIFACYDNDGTPIPDDTTSEYTISKGFATQLVFV